jgi:hypothetical protein
MLNLRWRKGWLSHDQPSSLRPFDGAPNGHRATVAIHVIPGERGAVTRSIGL